MHIGSPLVPALAMILGALLLTARHDQVVHAATPTLATASQTTEPKITPTLEPPSKPGAPSPTPALPEEGGPAGGVLGGYLFTDDDGDGKRSAGDSTTGGTITVRGTDLVDGGYPYMWTVQTDVRGHWELRGVPDGHYEVLWAPPLRDPAELARTIPPAQSVTIGGDTVERVVRSVEVVKANRILDIDFGMPHQDPVFGAPAPRLPNTGAGGGGAVSANEIVLFAGLAASALLALGLAVGRRRNARR